MYKYTVENKLCFSGASVDTSNFSANKADAKHKDNKNIARTRQNTVKPGQISSNHRQNTAKTRSQSFQTAELVKHGVFFYCEAVVRSTLFSHRG